MSNPRDLTGNAYDGAREVITSRMFSNPLLVRASTDTYMSSHPGLLESILLHDRYEDSEDSAKRIGDFVLFELAITYVERPDEFEDFKSRAMQHYLKLSRQAGDIATLNAMLGEPSPELQAMLIEMDKNSPPPDEDSGWVPLRPAPV